MPFQECLKICPICQQGKQFKFIRDFERKQDKFSLYQCSKCLVQFWLPLEIPKLSWYEEKAFRIKNIIKPKIYRGYHKKFLKIHKSFPKNTRILDLGCGAGEFINELQKRGCEVWGVDFDKENTKIAKEYFGLERVFTMSFEDFFQNKDLPKFDIISFLAVIGYLDNPLKFIRNIKNLLKPNGRIVLTAPCRERMLLNLNHWDFPPHYFTRWNKQAISNLFQKYNFDISYINYVEQFKILSEAVSGKFKTGLVDKSLAISENKQKSLIFLKIVYVLGCLKDYVIGTIPAMFLWIIGKIFKRNNGIMLIELIEARPLENFDDEAIRGRASTKIIFFISDLDTGGGQRVVSELSLNLPDWIETTIVLFKNKVSYPYKGKLISLDLPISHNFLLRMYCFFLGIYRFKKIIKKEKPNYVISFGIPADIISILCHNKTLVRNDSLWSESKNLGDRILIKLLFNKSEKIICVSKTVASDLVKNFRIKKEKIKIIYNPIDIEKIHNLIQEPLELKLQEIFKNPVIINAGRFSKEKNQAHLIKAFKHVRDKIGEVKLVILGKGTTEPYLKQIVKDLNLENSVYFLGWQNNPFKFLARAKLYILPSLREGLPYGILEAMACNLPIVSVDCKSGPREILAPNTDINQEAKDIEYADYGILCPINNENKLAEAMIKVLLSKQLSDNLIKKSKQRIEDFNVKKIIKKWYFLRY